MADDGWVPMRAPGTQQRLLITALSIAGLGFVLWFPIRALVRVVESWTGSSPLVSVGLHAALLAAAGAVAYLVVVERTQPPAIHVGRGILRVGRTERAFSEITQAKPEVVGGEGDDTLILRLLTSTDEGCSIVVSTREGHRLDTTQQDALLAMIRGSRIAPPVSKDDPTGRFAHVNFPEHLTRDGAVSLVEGTAQAGIPSLPGNMGIGGQPAIRRPGTPQASRRGQYGVAIFALVMGAFATYWAIQEPSGTIRGLPVIGWAVVLLAVGIGGILVTRRNGRRADRLRAEAAQADGASASDVDADTSASAHGGGPATPADRG
jgi:hypothetical protein